MAIIKIYILNNPPLQRLIIITLIVPIHLNSSLRRPK